MEKKNLYLKNQQIKCICIYDILDQKSGGPNIRFRQSSSEPKNEMQQCFTLGLEDKICGEFKIIYNINQQITIDFVNDCIKNMKQWVPKFIIYNDVRIS